MTVARPQMIAVPADGLFVYPIPAGTRLDSHGWFAFHHAWWRASAFRIRADRDTRAVFLDLLCAAQDEDPVGTLPVDADLLAHHADMTLGDWNRFMNRAVTPLHGWQLCVTDTGQRRYYHPRLLQVTQEAVRFRLADKARREADSERKRLEALPQKILDAGGSTYLAGDKNYVARLDAFLVEHVTGHRTVAKVRAAMEEMELAEQALPLARA